MESREAGLMRAIVGGAVEGLADAVGAESLGGRCSGVESG